jgi:hypothetical protein
MESPQHDHPASHRSLSSSPAFQEANDPRHIGVFVYLNGLLCRTADMKGRFCPGDVFGGVDHAPARVGLPLPTPRNDTEQRSLLRSAAGTERDTKGFESDCPIFNTFGVLSGGVLIDPFDETFVDYTQASPYTFTNVKPSASNTACTRTAAPCAAVEDVHVRNELAFRRGNFEHIRPTSALTLCTSERPLPKPAPTKPTAKSEAALRRSQRRSRVSASACAVDEWYGRLTLPRSTTSANTERHRATWRDAEAFRQLLMDDGVSRVVEPQSFFPPAIPFLYRERGTVLHRDDVGHLRDMSAANTEEDGGGVADIAPRGVRTAAASFVCYSGQPRFAEDSFNPARPLGSKQRVPPVQARLQKRLRPYDAKEAAQEPAQKRRQDNTSGETPLTSPAADSEILRDCKKTQDEVMEYFLVPYGSDCPRSAAYQFFLVYFNHLGLLYNGTRLTGETEATSIPPKLSHADPCEWGICPDTEYSAEAEVRRKRQITRRLWSNPETGFAGGSRWSTTARNRTAVSAAFTALMVDNRDALLMRIQTLNAYLHRLQAEAPAPVK